MDVMPSVWTSPLVGQKCSNGHQVLRVVATTRLGGDNVVANT